MHGEVELFLARINLTVIYRQQRGDRVLDLVQAVSESAHEEYILVATAYTPVSANNFPNTAFDPPAIFWDSKKQKIACRSSWVSNGEFSTDLAPSANQQVYSSGMREIFFCSSAEGDVLK